MKAAGGGVLPRVLTRELQAVFGNVWLVAVGLTIVKALPGADRARQAVMEDPRIDWETITVRELVLCVIAQQIVERLDVLCERARGLR